MKSIKILIAVAFLAQACNNINKKSDDSPLGNQPKTEVTENEEQLQMWAGTLSKAEVTSYQYGTHELKGNFLDGNPDNAGKDFLFAILSDELNLDEWLNKKVIITGNKVAGYPIENGPELINVTAIEEDKEIKVKK